MNDQMALKLIAAVMGWPEDDDGTATREYAWLRFMSSAKYDGYSDFRAGAQFLESLSTWLKQFDPTDRQAAYDFIKMRLVYVSPPELLCLIKSFVPEVVTPYLRKVVAQERGVEPYEIWSTAEGNAAFNRRLRKTLFVGMSDGSRIDMLRRANPRRISQEQVVPMLNIDDEKWKDLKKNLCKDLPGESFDSVYLIDDFTASGTTFLREVDENLEGQAAEVQRARAGGPRHIEGAVSGGRGLRPSYPPLHLQPPGPRRAPHADASSGGGLGSPHFRPLAGDGRLAVARELGAHRTK